MQNSHCTIEKEKYHNAKFTLCNRKREILQSKIHTVQSKNITMQNIHCTIEKEKYHNAKYTLYNRKRESLQYKIHTVP